MITLERVAGDNIDSDTNNWLADFLKIHALEEVLPEKESQWLQVRLRAVALIEIVRAIELDQIPKGLATIHLYQHWIVSQPPGSAYLYLAWFNLGATFSLAQDHSNAILAYQNSLALRPDFHSATVNLGTALEAVGQADAALRAWEQGLQPNQARATLLNNRARLLEQVGRLAEAEQELHRSLLTNPKQPDVIQHWVHVRQKMCAWPILKDQIPGLTVEDLLLHAGPMPTLALSDDVAVQCRAATDWITRRTFPVPLALSPPGGYRHDRIRLGYLSSDFCSHAMSYLIVELFESHDRDRFEVFGYCSSPEDNSAIRARVIRSFDHYTRIKHIPDEQAAQLIRDDEIDILIDLNGLTSGVRPQILRRKPAPIQATYLGFVGSVPFPELDYMFCDQVVVPLDRASAYKPTPIYIAGNYQANDSKRGIGPAMSRAEVGLPEEGFVFCCFSRHYKITETMFDSWMEILRAADNSVLWLARDNAWSEVNLQNAIAQAGIACERLIFADRIDPELYMSRLCLADLFLDTFPYNAGTVASDALRMELPLITLCGEAFASRMAASLLTALELPEGITTSRADYVEKAIKMATDANAFRIFRAGFTHLAWARSIGDIGHFTADFEAALSSLINKPPPCAARSPAASAPIEDPIHPHLQTDSCGRFTALMSANPGGTT
jgi:predicted O-linked N-acetylglucosamine transferase (SPINDLY family)